MLYQTKINTAAMYTAAVSRWIFSANTTPGYASRRTECAGLCPGCTATLTSLTAGWCRLSRAMSRCRRPIFSAETARQT